MSGNGEALNNERRDSGGDRRRPVTPAPETPGMRVELGRQVPLALLVSLASSLFMAGVFYATQGSTNTSASDRTTRLETSTTERLANLQIGVTEKLIKLETDMSGRINKLESTVGERQNRFERDVAARFEGWEKNAEGRSTAIYALENRMTRVEAQREFNNQNGVRR